MKNNISSNPQFFTPLVPLDVYSVDLPSDQPRFTRHRAIQGFTHVKYSEADSTYDSGNSISTSTPALLQNDFPYSMAYAAAGAGQAWMRQVGISARYSYFIQLDYVIQSGGRGRTGEWQLRLIYVKSPWMGFPLLSLNSRLATTSPWHWTQHSNVISQLVSYKRG